LAEVANNLEIKRIQLNRSLNGESFLSSGLLQRICDLFGVEGWIVLEFLGAIRSRDLKTKQKMSVLTATLCCLAFRK
jgi:hypothetical protein